MRDYDPSSGRYVESDPVGLQGGANTFSYALENPVSYTDPSGRIAWFVPVITGIVGGGISAGTNYLYQKYVQKKCKVDMNAVMNAGAWGVAAGALMPTLGTTVAGAVAIGTATGFSQYITGQLLSGEPITGEGMLIASVGGAVGGRIGGAFVRATWYGTIGTALPTVAANEAAWASVSANTSMSALVRNIAGAFASNVDPNAAPFTGAATQCGCGK